MSAKLLSVLRRRDSYTPLNQNTDANVIVTIQVRDKSNELF